MKAKSDFLIRHQIGDKVFSFFVILFLLTVLVTTIYPFLHIVALSFNDAIDTIRGGITIFPRDFTTATYRRLLSNPQIFSAAVMSVLRTATGVLCSSITTIMVAYTLSRKEFVIRKFLTVVMILTMYIAGGLIPQYFLYRSLGLLNNFLVYILPTLISPFHVIIIRTYIKSQPDSFVESGRLDGASELQIIFRIVMPLILPVTATVILFIAVFQWNSWFDTYIFANRNEALSTLQYELQKRLTSAMALVRESADGGRFSSGQDVPQPSTPESIRAAMTVVTTLPIVMVYPFLQRFFVSGLVVGGLKD
jgi:putative aldouronate transport system permease protein